MKTYAVFASLVLFATSSITAADLYVRPDGDDASAGSADAPGKAFRTIGKACTAAAPGDTIHVADGVYLEGEIKLAGKQGAADDRIVLKAANRHKALVQSTSPYHAVTVVNCVGVTIDGLAVSMKEPAKHHLFGIFVGDSNHVTVRNCYVFDIGSSGIQANGGEHYIVEDNIVRNCTWATGSPNGSGISFYHPRYVSDYQQGEWGIICRRNIIFDNYCPFKEFTEFPTDGNGIILDDFKNTQKHNKGGQDGGYSHPTLVENNLVFNNGGRGIHAFITDNATIRNNTVYGNNHELSRYNPYGWNGDLNVSGDNNSVYNNIVVFREGNPRGYAMLIGGKGNRAENNLVIGPVGLQENKGNPVPGDLPAKNTVLPLADLAKIGFAKLPQWQMQPFPDSTRLADRQFPFFADAVNTADPQLDRYFGLGAGSAAAGKAITLAPADDLARRKRPEAGASLGCFEPR